MVEQIFDGICRQLVTEFELPVYTERVVQNLKEPCLFVRLEKSDTELFFGKKYIMHNTFKVDYLDAGENEHFNCNAIVERLCGALEIVDYGDGTVRGSGMKCEINENYLQFYVDYDFFVYRYENEDDGVGIMGELDIDYDLEEV